MEVGIKIDELTNCLIEQSTGKKFNTEYKLIEKIDSNKAIALKNAGWSFDWSKPQESDYLVYGLYVKGSDELEGLIALKHIVDKLYTHIDNEGYVQFTAKNGLVEHYKETLKAKNIDWHNMYIDSYGAIDLIKKYFEEE